MKKILLMGFVFTIIFSVMGCGIENNLINTSWYYETEKFYSDYQYTALFNFYKDNVVEVDVDLLYQGESCPELSPKVKVVGSYIIEKNEITFKWDDIYNYESENWYSSDEYYSDDDIKEMCIGILNGEEVLSCDFTKCTALVEDKILTLKEGDVTRVFTKVE